jgi:hypothetical protein
MPVFNTNHKANGLFGLQKILQGKTNNTQLFRDIFLNLFNVFDEGRN